MKKLLKLWFLLNKRLYKKPFFIIVLISILLSVIAFGFLSKNESGFLTVMLYNADKTDAVSSQIITSLLEEDSMILFKKASSYNEAVEAVKNGKADSAWLFGENTEDRVKDFALGKQSDKAVTVVEREQSSALRLSHEKLNAKLFRYSGEAYYIAFIRKNLEELDGVSDEELSEIYESTNITDKLFVYGTPTETLTKQSSDYLLAPVKGLLLIIITICGMAGLLYYIKDKNAKTYDFYPQNKRYFLCFLNVLTSLLNVGTVVLIAIFATRLNTKPSREILLMALFLLSSSAFCCLLYSVLRKVGIIASLIPILTVSELAVCPIFFYFKSVRLISHIFPVTYYLRGIYDTNYIYFALIYSAVCFSVSFIISKLSRNF